MTKPRKTKAPHSEQGPVSVDGPILVVDDDPTLRRAVSRILRSGGHVVIEAENGEDAIELSKATRPSLMVLDYMMPGMDGPATLKEMRRELAGDAPPAVLLTASGEHERLAMEMGAVEGMTKPFRVNDLLNVVERYRKHRKPDA